MQVSLGSRQHPENWPAAMPDSLGTDHVMKVLRRPFEMENCIRFMGGKVMKFPGELVYVV